MKLEDFLILPHNHQQEQLWFRGSVLANRYEEAHIFLLYALDLFFVELQYDAADSKLLRLSAFTSTEPLTPYLPLLPDDILETLG